MRFVNWMFLCVIAVLLANLDLGMALMTGHRCRLSHDRRKITIHQRPSRQTSPQSLLAGTIWRRSVTKDSQDTDFKSSNNSKNQNVTKSISRFAKACVYFLWRGMTLPFPMLRAAETAISSSSTFFSLRECLCSIGAYLLLGAVAYTRIFERWSIVDALYFSVVSFSTVGYGDLCPSNLPSKIFTCIFGLGGVAFLGIAIATIGSSLIEVELGTLEAAKKLSQTRLMSAFEDMPRVLKTRKSNDEFQEPNLEARDTKTKLIKTETKPMNYWAKALIKAIPKFIPSILLMILGGGLMGRLEGWAWPDSIYFSFISAGTLGYGDFSPVTKLGRLCSVAFIPMAVATAGEFLGGVTDLLRERRQQIRNEQLLERKLDMNYLLELDADKNGEVDRMEYITFMLKEMGVVDQALLDELNAQFDRLDEDKSNTLGIEDLKLMAELSGVAKFSTEA